MFARDQKIAEVAKADHDAAVVLQREENGRMVALSMLLRHCVKDAVCPCNETVIS
jgi:hypothetical protein